LNEFEQCLLVAKAKVEKSFALKDWGGEEAQRIDLDIDISVIRMERVDMRTL
jgi:hypothetical protein